MLRDHTPARARLPLWFGLVPTLSMLMLAAFGPSLLTVDPNKQTLLDAYASPFSNYLLGADHLGRSIAARLVDGARASLGLAFAGVVASAVTGAMLGLLAAYYRRWPRRIVMRLADIIIACPTLLFVILVSGLLGGGLWPLFLAIWVSQWPGFARLADAAARRELIADHVEAARLLGFSTWYIVRRHVLPGIGPYIYSLAALSLGANVLTISSVGFLGIGLRPPAAEWGAMIAESLSFARTAPHLVLVPAAAILICTWSATLIGEYYGTMQQTDGVDAS
ncbi:ABC transporter permease (plasmid) [Nitrobacteraceae bacterium UC4446_H13]